MDDFKKLAVEFYGMVLEEHVYLGIAAISNSDDIFDHFMDASHKVNQFMIEHEKEFKRALIEVKANEMLNQEV